MDEYRRSGEYDNREKGMQAVSIINYRDEDRLNLMNWDEYERSPIIDAEEMNRALVMVQRVRRRGF